MANKKTKLFTMKLSAEELAKYKELATSHDLPLSQLIHKLLNNQPIQKRKKIPKADPQLIRQVAAIGNNLNQIARATNQGKKIDVIPHLVAIENYLKTLVEKS